MDLINNFIKRNKTFFILFILIVSFYTFLRTKFHQIVINNILTKIDASIFLDAISIIGIIILSIVFLWPKIKKNYYIGFDYFFKSAIILSFLIYIRLWYIDDLLKFSVISFLTYFDVLLFIVALPFFLFTVYHIRKFLSKSEQIKKSIFLEDTAIKKINQDELRLNRTIESLKRKIISIYSTESVAIGITGKWGDGKTSFMHLLKEKINNDTIIIDFNPWLNLNTEHITQEFFNVIENKINDYSLNSSKEFKEYASYITDIDNTGLIDKALKKIDFNNNLSVEEKFNNINQSLKKIDKKIIVFIDDIDRLQANEILDILKLIRNTANFYNFIYIVAYDKEYVLDSLKNLNIPNHNKFIDKIFIEEIKLLPLSANQLKSIFLKYLELVIPVRIEDVKQLINSGVDGRELGIHNILSNIRDIKRFINAFSLNYHKLENDILFSDYFILQLIKFKYYNVYLILFKKNYLRFSEPYQSLSFDENFSTLIPNQDNSNDVSFKDSLLRDDVIELKYYTDFELLNIGKLIDLLFPQYGYNRTHLAINRSKSFYKYFREEINENDIPFNDFTLFTQLTYDEMVKKSNEYLSYDKIDSLIFHLVNVNFFKLQDKMEYEKLFSICFYVNEINISFYRSISYETLWYKSIGKIEDFARKYYNGNTDELKQFIIKLLHKSKLNYSVIGYCKMVDRSVDENEYYKKEEFYNIIIDHFEEYCNRNNTIDNEFWSLFNYCYFTKWINENNRYYENKDYIPLRAINLFKEFMKKDLDNILISFLRPQSFYYETPNHNKISISQEIPNIFGSYSNLKNLLESKSFINSLRTKSKFRKDFIEIMNQLGDLDINSNSSITDQQLNSTFPPLLEMLENSKYIKRNSSNN